MRRFITGLAEYCYNGIAVIRGYAPADILIDSSKAHNFYQRPKEDTSAEEICHLSTKKVQSELAAKVQESFALRKESKRLLDLAKHAVEVAIEQGEDAAMKLLERCKDA